jgi:hypothetical protein
LRVIWHSNEKVDFKKLGLDYDGGQKIRFKARILNMKNVRNSTTEVWVELGGNELNIFGIQISIYPNINIGDILLIDVTPQEHFVLKVEKI